MLSWYKFEIKIAGGVSYNSLKTPLSLDSSHKLSMRWSLLGLTVQNILQDCLVKYADGTTICLDNADILLPWEMLEKGKTEFLIENKTKAVCQVQKMSSLEDWETFKNTSVNMIDAVHFETLKILKDSSITQIESDINWLKKLKKNDSLDPVAGSVFWDFLQNCRTDMYYKALFSRGCYEGLPKEQKIRIGTSVEKAYHDILNKMIV